MKFEEGASRRSFLASLVASAATSAVFGCHSPPRTPALETPKALRTSPLLSLVPAVGLNWLVLVRPRDFFDVQEFEEPLASLFPPARTDALVRMTGLDPRSLSQAAIASFGHSTLWLGTGEIEPAMIEARFHERLWADARRRVLAPGLVRLSGRVGMRSRSLVLIGDDTAAMAVGDPKLASAVEAYALDRLRSVSAFEALSEVARRRSENSLFAAALGPFDAEWSRGARGLLRTATVVDGAVHIGPNGRMLAEISVQETAPGQSEDARGRVLASWNDLVSSPLGRLMALDRLLAEPRVRVGEDEVAIEVEVDGPRMLRGLADIVAMRL